MIVLIYFALAVVAWAFLCDRTWCNWSAKKGFAGGIIWLPLLIIFLTKVFFEGLLEIIRKR